jgi:Xaa-Pro aminopeptidase
VFSVETEFVHPEVGAVNIEDARAVTATGSQALGAPFGTLRVR